MVHLRRANDVLLAHHPLTAYVKLRERILEVVRDGVQGRAVLSVDAQRLQIAAARDADGLGGLSHPRSLLALRRTLPEPDESKEGVVGFFWFFVFLFVSMN